MVNQNQSKKNNIHLDIVSAYDIMDLSFFTITGIRLHEIMDSDPNKAIPTREEMESAISKYTNVDMYNAVTVLYEVYRRLYVYRLVNIDSLIQNMFLNVNNEYLYNATLQCYYQNKEFFESRNISPVNRAIGSRKRLNDNPYANVLYNYNAIYNKPNIIVITGK